MRRYFILIAAIGLAACQQNWQIAPDALSGTNSSLSTGTSGGTTPAATRTPATAAPQDLSQLGAMDLFKDVADPMALRVDSQYPTQNSLTKIRSFNVIYDVDYVDPILKSHDRFADRIAFAVYKKMQKMQIDIDGDVAPVFSLNKDYKTYMPTSLMSHSFCPVTKQSLVQTYQNKNIPSDAVIQKAQTFTNMLNQARASALAGNADGKLRSYRIWTKFMMCVGYMESLTAGDSAESQTLAQSLGIARPPGVNLHNDNNQKDPGSVFGVGLFQESNVVKSGDTYSCVSDWNRQFPEHAIDINISSFDMIQNLISTYQTFNAYCGVSQVARMFGVQVNATRAFNTHPANVNADGSLKAPADRCVSPFMNVNTSYNHFAPLQNGSGFTLDNILTCTLANE